MAFYRQLNSVPKSIHRLLKKELKSQIQRSGSVRLDPYHWITYTDLVRYTSAFNDKKILRSHKTLEIKIFFDYLPVDGRIRMRIRIRILTNNYGSGRLKGFRIRNTA